MLMDKIRTEFSMEMEKAEAQMTKENLDASVIKYNAIRDAKTALYNKEFKCSTVKT